MSKKDERKPPPDDDELITDVKKKHRHTPSDRGGQHKDERSRRDGTWYQREDKGDREQRKRKGARPRKVGPFYHGASVRGRLEQSASSHAINLWRLRRGTSHLRKCNLGERLVPRSLEDD